MNDELQGGYANYHLLRSINNKISISDDLVSIFGVVFSELLQVIGGVESVIELVSNDNRTCYYGFWGCGNCVYWEPGEESNWSPVIDSLMTSVSALPDKKSFVINSELVFAELSEQNGYSGYIAVKICNANNQEDVENFVTVAVEQITTILRQKNDLQEKQRHKKRLMLERVVSSLIHDMKNPLCGVSGFVQLISLKTDSDVIRTYCDTINDSLDILNTLSIEMLDTISNRSLTLEYSEISLESLFKDILKSASEILTHSGIEADLSCSNDIVLSGDRSKLKKAFRNIINNAREAQMKGGNLRISIQKKEAMAIITIGDDGCGIPVRIHKDIYEPFFSYEKGNFTGIGLTVAQCIIKNHNGSISATSELKKGTVFTIQIPLVQGGMQ